MCTKLYIVYDFLTSFISFFLPKYYLFIFLLNINWIFHKYFISTISSHLEIHHATPFPSMTCVCMCGCFRLLTVLLYDYGMTNFCEKLQNEKYENSNNEWACRNVRCARQWQVGQSKSYLQLCEYAARVELTIQSITGY